MLSGEPQSRSQVSHCSHLIGFHFKPDFSNLHFRFYRRLCALLGHSVQEDGSDSGSGQGAGWHQQPESGRARAADRVRAKLITNGLILIRHGFYKHVSLND